MSLRSGGRRGGGGGGGGDDSSRTKETRIATIPVDLPSSSSSSFSVQPVAASLFPLQGNDGAPSISSSLPSASWRSALPALSNLPDLKSWSSEGLGSVERERMGSIVRVYSLGFSQLTRAVRAGMSNPSPTVAALWKLLVFLLHECMPDGSVYSGEGAMRIASLERQHTAEARRVHLLREKELQALLSTEKGRQGQVHALDLELRRMLALRQNAEHARHEAMDQIEAQQALQRAVEEEIAELSSQETEWETRYQLAWNRHHMLCEDVRQGQVQRAQLQTEQQALTRECSSHDLALRHLQVSFDAVCSSLASALDDRVGLSELQENLTAELVQAQSAADSLADLLNARAATVAKLTQQALREIQDRIRATRLVEAIKKELADVVAIEKSSALIVASLFSELSEVVSSVSSSDEVRTGLEAEVSAVRTDLARTIEQRDATLRDIELQRNRINTIELTQEQRKIDKSKIEAELEVLKSQLTSEDSDLVEADHRLSAATSALDSLSASIVRAEGDLVSLNSDVRALEGRRVALSTSVEERLGQVVGHDAAIERRVQAMHTDIKNIGADIVQKAQHMNSMQEDTVKFKQMQLDYSSSIASSEATLSELLQSGVEDSSALAAVDVSAASIRRGVEVSSEQLCRAEVALSQARDQLLQTQQEHKKTVQDLRNQIEGIEQRDKNTQQQRAELGQQMDSLSADRQQLLSAHSSAMQVELDASALLDAEEAAATLEHEQWMEAAQMAQQQLQDKLQQTRDQIAVENESAVALAATLASGLEKRSTEQSRLVELDGELEAIKKSNVAQSALVDDLRSQVAAAVAAQLSLNAAAS